MTELPDLHDLIPHRGPMLLLDRLVDKNDTVVVCEVSIRADSSFFRAGRVAAIVALEYMAQTAAAWLGLWALRNNQRPSGGYLLGTRELLLHVDGFALGDNLLVEAHHAWGEEDLRSFNCRVTRRGELAAQATVNVLRNPNP